MSGATAQRSVLLEGFTTEELDRELLARAVERSATEIQRMECVIFQLRTKHDRRVAELARRRAVAASPSRDDRTK